MDLSKIINKQDCEAKILEDLNEKFCQATLKYQNLINKIPFEKILKKHDIIIYEDADKNLQAIANLYLKEKDKYIKISKEFNEYAEYKESLKFLKIRDKTKNDYFVQFYKYWELIHADREKTFSQDYKQKIKHLNQAGLFLNFMQTPDLDIDGIPIENIEDYVVSILEEHNYLNLHYLLSGIFGIKNYSSDLEYQKINDLKEAFLCLTNNAYNSCARTIFALIENEHYQTSRSINITKGSIRAEKIQRFVNGLNVKYYIDLWEVLNQQYKKFNISVEEMENNINRNDLMHGSYKKRATSKDCVKLFTFYITFKELSFIIKEYNLFIEELKGDLLPALLKQSL